MTRDRRQQLTLLAADGEPSVWPHCFMVVDPASHIPVWGAA